MGKIYNGIAETIGNTPLVRPTKITAGIDAQILLKLESFNPFSSSKDRVGLALLQAAERDNLVKPDTVFVEPTSGNTGIALAATCAAKGYKLILTMPDLVSSSRQLLLTTMGAEVILTTGTLGMPGAIRKARQLVADNPSYLLLNQFENPAGAEIHRLTTGPEIWRDTEGKVDIVVAGVGSGGTITGVAEALKSRNPHIQAVAVEPATSPVLSGGKPGLNAILGLGAGFVPPILKTTLLDEVIRVSEHDAALFTMRLTREEGIMVGISSGAALWAAMQIGDRRENAGKTIVAIMPDCGERYLDSWFLTKR